MKKIPVEKRIATKLTGVVSLEFLIKVLGELGYKVQYRADLEPNYVGTELAINYWNRGRINILTSESFSDDGLEVFSNEIEFLDYLGYKVSDLGTALFSSKKEH